MHRKTANRIPTHSRINTMTALTCAANQKLLRYFLQMSPPPPPLPQEVACTVLPWLSKMMYQHWPTYTHFTNMCHSLLAFRCDRRQPNMQDQMSACDQTNKKMESTTLISKADFWSDFPPPPPPTAIPCTNLDYSQICVQPPRSAECAFKINKRLAVSHSATVV